MLHKPKEIQCRIWSDKLKTFVRLKQLGQGITQVRRKPSSNLDSTPLKTLSRWMLMAATFI